MLKHLHAAHHNQTLHGGLIMTDPRIQNSQQLLKSLKKDMLFLNSLMAQINFVVFNLNRTWESIDKLERE